VKEIVLADSQVDAAVEAIIKAARTGKIGDGKVFISTIEESVRIRTDERGRRPVSPFGFAMVVWA
jgi:nitrogen regulatory protein P-II 1